MYVCVSMQGCILALLSVKPHNGTKVPQRVLVATTHLKAKEGNELDAVRLGQVGRLRITPSHLYVDRLPKRAPSHAPSIPLGVCSTEPVPPAAQFLTMLAAITPWRLHTGGK